jgi:hypothetical protein
MSRQRIEVADMSCSESWPEMVSTKRFSESAQGVHSMGMTAP